MGRKYDTGNTASSGIWTFLYYLLGFALVVAAMAIAGIYLLFSNALSEVLTLIGIVGMALGFLRDKLFPPSKDKPNRFYGVGIFCLFLAIASGVIWALAHTSSDSGNAIPFRL